MKRVTWSLGTSTRTAAEFVALLRVHGIEQVADVRRFPRSRRHEQYNREAFARLLKRAGVSYRWLGDALGGYRAGGYEAYTATGAFADGMTQLEQMAADRPTAFVCAERLPWKCHRRFIGQALADRGWDVRHIVEEGRTWQPRAQQTQLGL